MNQKIIETGDGVRRLACQEVRGGNHLAAYSAELPGLAGWVSCHPLQPSPRGGDVYYMSACSQGVMARVVLADMAGHGETVSAAAGRLREALRRHVERWDQSALIRQLNDSILEGAEHTRFATAFVASYYSIPENCYLRTPDMCRHCGIARPQGSGAFCWNPRRSARKLSTYPWG